MVFHAKKTLLSLFATYAAMGLNAQPSQPAASLPNQATTTQQTQLQFSNAAVAKEEKDLKATAEAADNWFKLLDQGNYGATWDTGSNIFRFTIKRDEWIKAQEKLHSPLGKLVSRKLIEQRPAKNPKGLPEGDYMVLYYKSSYANRPDTNELVTMVLSTDGQWKVLTYHAS